MSLRPVPGFNALVKVGSPNTKGAGDLVQVESSKESWRQAFVGSEASANPLIYFQVEFDCTKVVRESSVKVHVAPAPVALKGIGGPLTPRSAMSWFVAQVILTVPEAGCDTLKM